MKTLSLLSNKPTPPQDLPVDLTTRGHPPPHCSLLSPRIPPMSYEASYPHLRFHKSVIEEPEKAKEKYTVEVILKETEGSSLKERKGAPLLPKKRRHDEIDSEVCASSKRQRVESQSYLPTSYAPQSYFPGSFDGINDYGSPLRPMQYFDQSHVMEHAAILDRMQNRNSISGSADSIKETEALMAAVQHSQMLYYSYCTQLLQNLQAQRVVHEHEQSAQELKNQTIKVTSRDFFEGTPVGNPTEALKKKELTPERKLSDHQSPTSSESAPSLEVTTLAPTSTPSPVGSTSFCSGNEREDKVSSSAERKLYSGRKRVPRALTGKHVRPGTGASITTLLSLRQKLNQRLKMRQEEKLNNIVQHVESVAKSDRSSSWRRR